MNVFKVNNKDIKNDFNVILMSLLLELNKSQTLIYWISSEAVAQRCSLKKVFWEISRNSQENTRARVSF